MLTELLNRLLDVGAATRPPILKPEKEPDYIYYLRNPQGNYELREAHVPPRCHQVYSLLTIASLAKGHPGSTIWVSSSGVRLLFDEERRDSATLVLTPHPIYSRLQALEKRTLLSQRDFVRLLKLDLAGTQSRCPTLAEAAQAVKCRQVTTSEGVIQQGKASLGKSLEAELTGVRKFPETVRLEIPMWRELVCPASVIECYLEVDPATETFCLTPLPGALDLAMAQTVVGWLMERLTELMQPDTHIPIYHGSP